ncbi:DUF3703 domain-containing protein [Polyangium sp. y55x31]|uniref:DUF3703 domain-containing protein n=1 Tax=Polyangium sp. y55x31 TaxID=3042688 RepID=UPI002482142D|nr:DUF3703 domain-containing protein [Polyangium sp. y55x31]MDI1477605.1 DUF3703 domain-containing protein [Polyangium sp. y55x31]
MNTKMAGFLKAELDASTAAEANGDMATAWRALERAHILSQAFAVAHTGVHWAMFRFAYRRGDVREMLGQVPRLLLAAPGSLLGRAPLGNTGGANVGIFRPMPIPEDLRAKLASAAERS